MFPNIRLLIGALFASVVTLCCGFGIFAAYRVSHEPLGRLPANTAALQLVANEPAGSPAAWGTSLASHTDANGTRLDAAITSTPVADRTETADGSSPWTTESIKSEAAADAVPPAAPLASPPPKSSTAVARMNVPPTPRSPAVNAAAPAASLAATSKGEPPKLAPTITADETAATPKAVAPTTTKVSLSTASTAAPQKLAAASLIDKPAADAGQPVTAKADASPVAAIPAVASIEQPPQPASPTEAPADIANSEPAAAAPEIDLLPKPRPTFPTSARKVVRKSVERQQVTGRRVVRRTATATTPFGYPNAAFHEPVFQSAPQLFQSQPATGRWTAGKATPRAATSNSTSATSGWPNVE
jgi:hypothetical protein